MPRVIAQAPALDDGSPFPTLMWLSCPHLVSAVSELEAAGWSSRWTARIAAEGDLAAAVLASDAAYREARRAEGGGSDPCAGVGVAGQADPLAVKCLHSRVAAALAGIPDPVGARVVEAIASAGPLECSGGSCAPAGDAPAAGGSGAAR